MTSIVLGVVGAAAGFAIGGPSGAYAGWTIGSGIGGIIDPITGANTQGPRIGDLAAQGSTYGSSIPIYYGTARGSGQVIWSSNLIETAHEEEADGGKGGGGGGESYTTYTYSINCAVGVCEGEIVGISRIWANGEVIYDIRATNLGATGQSSNIRVYTGSETQLPDSLIEAYQGAGNVPAHRGLAYVVFQNFQLEKYGNRIPNFTFEIVANGTASAPLHQKVSEGLTSWVIPHPFIENVYLSTSKDSGTLYLHVTDVIARTDRKIAIPLTNPDWSSNFITYVPFGYLDTYAGLITRKKVTLNEIWVCTSRHDFEATNEVAVAFDAYTLTFKRRITPTVNVGRTYVGKMVFDRSYGKVLFATSGSTTGDGLRYLDPISILWDPIFSSQNTDWYVSDACIGENYVAMSTYHNIVNFFALGGFVHKVTTTYASTKITFDSRRNRFLWFNGNISGNAQFMTVEDFSPWKVVYINTTITGIPNGATKVDYLPIADKFAVRYGDNLKILNGSTLALEKDLVMDLNSEEGKPTLEVPAMMDYVVGYVNNSPTSGLALIPLGTRLASTTTPLSTIVQDICTRTDLDVTDIDTSQLTDPVNGYIITQQMTGRAAIDSLQAAYFFDAVESD